MPTIVSHAAVPLAASLIGGRKVPGRLVIAGIIASVLPDADVIGFHFGIPYGHMFGHRGFFHSIAFAFLLALFGLALARRLHSSRFTAFLVIFVSALSHGILDALTSGGLGIAFLSPFSNERFFFPWHPIAVSPLSLRRFFDSRGLEVILSEVLWIWMPAIVAGLLGVIIRRAVQRGMIMPSIFSKYTEFHPKR